MYEEFGNDFFSTLGTYKIISFLKFERQRAHMCEQRRGRGGERETDRISQAASALQAMHPWASIQQTGRS